MGIALGVEVEIGVLEVELGGEISGTVHRGKR